MSPGALESFINSDYHKLADVRLLDFFQHLSPLALREILALLEHAERLEARAAALRARACEHLRTGKGER